jgi:hypothetical protein
MAVWDGEWFKCIVKYMRKKAYLITQGAKMQNLTYK